MGRNSYDSLSSLGCPVWNDVSVRLFLEEQFPCCLPTLHAFPVKYGKTEDQRFIYLTTYVFCFVIYISVMCVLLDWSSIHAISFYQQIIFSDNCWIFCVPGWLCDTGSVLNGSSGFLRIAQFVTNHKYLCSLEHQVGFPMPRNILKRLGRFGHSSHPMPFLRV